MQWWLTPAQMEDVVSARKNSDGDLQQLPSLSLGYGMCAPALPSIRINFFVVHVPHHGHAHRKSGAAITACTLFSSQLKNILQQSQAERCFPSSYLKPLML